MDYKKILQDINNKVYYPFYLLYGDEPYYIDLISKHIEKSVLSDAEKEFNQQVLYGLDLDVSTLVNHSKRFPMMANHMVVIVKEAQHIKKIEELIPYLENPQPSTLLVINYKYKKPDRRKPFYKVFVKKGVVFHSEKLRDYKVPDWITAWVKSNGYRISEKNSVLLAEYLGNDLGKITNEIGKVIISLKKGEEITGQIIESGIGMSKDFNNFEFHNSLGRRDIYKANQIAQYFGDNKKEHPFPLIISQLYGYFSKLFKLHFIKTHDNREIAAQIGAHPFYVKDYISAKHYYSARKIRAIISDLRQYDLYSKGLDNTTATDSELLKELVYKILH